MVVRVFVSAGLIGWLVFRYDWGEVFAAIRSVPVTVVGFSLFTMLVSQVVTARRLQALLAAQAINLSYFYILRLNFTGLFAGNYLPSTVGGDALKLIILARTGVIKTAAVASLAADRLISMASMVFFLPVTLSAAESFQLRAGSATILTAGAAGLSVALSAGIVYYFYRKGAHQNQPSAGIKRVVQIVTEIKTIAAAWVAQPRTLLMVILLSVFSILCGFLAGWLLLSWGLNIKIAPLEWIAVSVLVYFISVLPVSINGWGLQETGIVFLLSHYGASPEKALTFAVLIRILMLAVSLPGAFGMLVSNTRE